MEENLLSLLKKAIELLEQTTEYEVLIEFKKEVKTIKKEVNSIEKN